MTNFAFQLKGKKIRKRTKMHFLIIWIERIPLLQVYFSHFIPNQDTIFKDICFEKVLHFVLLVPPLVGFTMDLQTCHLEGRYHARIILLLLSLLSLLLLLLILWYYEVLLYFFFWINFSRKLYSFAFWRKKIRRHLVKVVLLYVVFCKA